MTGIFDDADALYNPELASDEISVRGERERIHDHHDDRDQIITTPVGNNRVNSLSLSFYTLMNHYFFIIFFKIVLIY